MLFSVIVPIYRVEDFLRKCVDSFLNQTFADFELILVDDGSPDGSPRICDEYAEKDARVRVIHKENGGVVSARKAGIHAAQGDYICFADGDDWVRPDLLAFVGDRIANAEKRVDIVCFGAEIVFGDHTKPMKNDLEDGYYDKPRLEKEIYPYLFCGRRTGNGSVTVINGYAWNKVMRRELLLEHHLRDERIRMFEDIAFTYECLLNADYVYICSEPLYYYNKTNQNAMTQEKREYLKENYAILFEYLHQRLDGYGPDIRRQLHLFAADLILIDSRMQIKTAPSLSEAAKRMRNGLETTGMMRFVCVKELPFKTRLFMGLLQKKLYLPAMALRLLRHD